MLSMKWSTLKPQNLPFLQYVVCLAFIDCLKCLPIGSEPAQLLSRAVKIKWPNDLYVGDKKIGGILCQSVMNSKKIYNVTIGVGVNLYNSAPTTCLQNLLSEIISNERIAKNDLLACFLNTLESHLLHLESNGFAPFLSSYLEKWMHTNQPVFLQDEQKNVVITGLTESGFLKAINMDSSQVFELHPDGNSLNFLTGLVSKKVI